MLLKILKNDLKNNKAVSLILFAFIMLSTLALASSTVIAAELAGSLDSMFESAAVPHFVQMHKGDIDQPAIDRFSASHDAVTDQQTVKMLSIDGSQLILGSQQESESKSVLDISFVRQNTRFDYLLSMDNEIIDLNKGEIGVPFYYIKEDNLEPGDTVTLQTPDGIHTYTIAYFIRDSIMNPSMASSKRFLISDTDYTILENQIHEVEYLIEFRLNDLESLRQFAVDYESSGLAHRGPMVDYTIFQLLNMLTSGVVILIVVFISILLTAITIISLRFILLSVLEDDIKEIGVMKAIGVAHRDIRSMYMAKYLLLAVLGSLAGVGGSLLLRDTLAADIRLYMGSSDTSLAGQLLPLSAALLITAVVALSCGLILKYLKNIPVLTALLNQNNGTRRGISGPFSLHRVQLIGVNLFLGLKDIVSRSNTYLLLLCIFITTAFVMLLPVNVFNTMNSENFSAYMGIEESDIRIDLQQSENMEQRFQETLSYLEHDPEVEKMSAMITCRYSILNNEGMWDNINISTGDASLFPLTFLKGSAPSDGEIALSYLNSQELEASIGDELTLLIDGEEVNLTVSGIYQDVTNGGKSARAALPVDKNNLLWYVINIDIRPGFDLEDKILEYSSEFSQTKITDLKNYVLQTFGDTLAQLRTVRTATILIASLTASLITSMFLKMMITRDRSQIAIMKNLGFSSNDLTIQYTARTLLILAAGIILGTLLCNTLGEVLISALGSSFGAPEIHFEINPLEAYFVYPTLLMIVTGFTTVMNCLSMKKTTTTTDMFE